jgi:hypothetical protein
MVSFASFIAFLNLWFEFVTETTYQELGCPNRNLLDTPAKSFILQIKISFVQTEKNSS